jgi:hypothetical protein
MRLGFVAVVLSVAAAVVGCTLEEGSAPPERQKLRPVASGASAADEAMARRVVRYLHRNARDWPWYRRVEEVSVDGGVVTIETTIDLEENPDAGLLACSFIQGSDVADFTPGHRIEGRRDTAFDCPNERRY